MQDNHAFWTCSPWDIVCSNWCHGFLLYAHHPQRPSFLLSKWCLGSSVVYQAEWPPFGVSSFIWAEKGLSQPLGSHHSDWHDWSIGTQKQLDLENSLESQIGWNDILPNQWNHDAKMENDLKKKKDILSVSFSGLCICVHGCTHSYTQTHAPHKHTHPHPIMFLFCEPSPSRWACEF